MKTYLLNIFLSVIISFSLFAQDVPYVPTPQDVVNEMLRMANVTENDIVYDLGSGDGRIVITAARDFNARKAIGVDTDKDLLKKSRQNAKNANVEDRVEFRDQNLFETDLTEATVLTMYLLSSVNLQLRPKLFEQLKPGTRVVSHTFTMGEWEPENEKSVNGHSIYFWTIPANISGNWEVNGSDQAYSLRINQEFNKFNGSMMIGDQRQNITDGVIEGDKVSFTVKGSGTSTINYEGTINEDVIELKGDGKSLTAQRREGTKQPVDPRAATPAENDEF
jgi:precorrin-6B methylase 2